MAATSRSPRTQEIALLDALNTLNSRIERTEDDFIGHLQKVEDRLDQLVDLTRTVAVLQQQSTQQTDQITELRTQMREGQQKNENSISRIYSRLDEIINNQRDKIELHSKDVDIKIKSIETKITDEDKEIKTEIKNVSNAASNTEKELKTWLNRGWGAWFVFILFFGAVQTAVYKWVDNIQEEKNIMALSVKELNLHKERSEISSKQNDVTLNTLKEEVRRNSMSVRDLEDLIRRQQK